MNHVRFVSRSLGDAVGWLPTLLVAHSALVPLGVLVDELGSGALGWVGRKSPRVLGWLVGLTVVGVLGVTLAPDDRGRVGEVTCEVGVNLPSWGSNELLANTALFVPVGVGTAVVFLARTHAGRAGAAPAAGPATDAPPVANPAPHPGELVGSPERG